MSAMTMEIRLFRYSKSDNKLRKLSDYGLILSDKPCNMSSTKANILLFPILLLFLLFNSSCKQSETEQTDTSISSNSIDSISKLKPPTDYRELCLRNSSYYLADSLYALRKLSLANPYYEKAAVQFESEGSQAELIHTLNRLAWSNMILGDKVSAKQFIDKAENLAEIHLSDDKFLWAEIYRSKGNYHSNAGMYDESLKAYEHSLKIMQDVYGNNSIKVAEIYLLIGYLYSWSIMDPYSAIDNYFSAMKILENNKLENEETYILCLYNLAVTNNTIGELNKAKSFTLKLLQTIEIGDPEFKYYEEFGNSFLAIIYYYQGEYIKAINHSKKSIELNISNSLVPNDYLASYYNTIGLCYLETDSISKSISNCEFAINMYNSSKHDSSGLSDSYNNLSSGYQKIGEFDHALQCLMKCLQIRKNIYSENHEKTSKAYLDIGTYYLEIGNNDSSLHYLKKSIESGCDNFRFSNEFSLPLRKNFGDNYFLISALNHMAKLYLNSDSNKNIDSLEYINLSMNLYLLCDSLIDKSRNHLEQEDSKLRYASTIQNIYENAINTAYILYEITNDSKYFNQVYHFMEKNRARILLDNIHSMEEMSSSPISDSIYILQKKFQYKIRNLNQRISEVESIGKSSAIDSLNLILFDEFRESEKLQEYIREYYPSYYRLNYNFENIDIESLISYSPNTSFLEFFWGENSIYAIGFDLNQRICYRIDIASVEKSIRTLNRIFNTKYASMIQDFSNFTKEAYFLYQILIAPIIENQIVKNGNERASIRIIPDGLLAYLPFEALITALPDHEEVNYKNLDYLINKYEIAYSFSSNILAYHQQKGRSKKIRNVLALSYYGNDLISDSSETNYLKQNLLAGTEKELKGISKYYKGKYLNGIQATESAFRKFCYDYDAIHLAVHGIYDSLNNYNTYLKFNSVADSMEDGKLYNYDLFPLKLNSKLAVLSACETGLGKDNPGEGLLSMGWGFAYAGCKSLILSLWKTEDQSTSTLMMQFYKQLSTSNNINLSLAESKRIYLSKADEYTAHPKYWAAFINYGIINSSTKPNNYRISIYIIITAILFLLTIIAAKIRK